MSQLTAPSRRDTELTARGNGAAATPCNGDREARRELHAHIFGLHEAIDRLEADETLHVMDFLLVGAEALFLSGVTRFEQLAYCLQHYGRPTPAAPIPLTKIEGAYS